MRALALAVWSKICREPAKQGSKPTKPTTQDKTVDYPIIIVPKKQHKEIDHINFYLNFGLVYTRHLYKV